MWSSRPLVSAYDGSPLPDKDAGKNPHAVALGKLGGAKGGKARSEALRPAKRRGGSEAAPGTLKE